MSKDNIKVGNLEREFDLISNDQKIIVQVKFCKIKLSNMTPSQENNNRATRYPRFLVDCISLERAKAKEKIFFLFADKELFNDFEFWAKGLISPEVTLRFGNLEK